VAGGKTGARFLLLLVFGHQRRGSRKDGRESQKQATHNGTESLRD